MAIYITGAAVLVLILFLALSYNALVKLRNLCTESWSNVDTELKRRYDLVPNLVNTVKGYAAHEKSVFEEVANLRNTAVASTGSPASQARDENALIGGLNRLFAVVERYPELKASANFLNLQSELRNTEDRIQAARRFYNGNIRDYNSTVQSVPTNIIAGLFGFRPGEFFEIEDVSIRAAPSVRL